MKPAPCTMRLPARLSSVRILCEFATSGDPVLPHDRRLALHLALEEILVNIVRYAYAGGEAGHIEVTRTWHAGALNVVISDTGKPFDPLQQQTPDLDAGLENRSIGGLGIFLAKSIASAASYSRKGARNTIHLRFDALATTAGAAEQ